MAEARTLRELAAAPIAELGLAPGLRSRLESMGLSTFLDVLQHYPRRYHDRTRSAEIASLRPGDEVTVVGEVRRIAARRTRNRRVLVEAVVGEGSATVDVSFFNQAWREKQLPEGTEVALFGKVDDYRGRLRFTNPVVDVLGRAGQARTGVVVPIYPQSGKADVSTWELQPVVAAALERTGPLVEPLPGSVLEDLKLVDRTVAYHDIHRPSAPDDARRARRRLRFDEFLRMQVGLVARKRAVEAAGGGIAHRVDGPLVERFLGSLPFELTGDQRRAVEAVAADMARPVPMHRLLQGEVGSGKTLVAVAALLMAVQGGHQGALMAPTEVLAEQLHGVARELLDGLTLPSEGTLTGERPLSVALLTNRTGAAERRRLAQGLQAGDVDVVVGTHALLYGDAPFRDLGIAVIDEQHRFGVEQRALLRGASGPGADPGAARAGAGDVRTPVPDAGIPDGGIPDVLVMTATPIPRTAAMLVYGDLDRSELREMPPGRAPVTTRVVTADDEGRAVAYERLGAEVRAGRQGYVVCPLVEGSERVAARAATGEYERLRSEELAGLRVGLLHGQMPAADKERAMAEFRSGAVDVLVATTVIEVGVDVPNATVMVVEDAHRFGLSQLHQLRGRVGRGSGASWCFLVADATTPEAEARMEAMAASGDGFDLAERDLEIRGAGEVFGERQAGMGDLKLGRLPRDSRYVEFARRTAEDLLDADPALARHRALAEEVEDLLGDDVEFLFKS